MKKVLISIFIVIIVVSVGFIGLIIYGLNTDTTSLELEKIYYETNKEEDLYKLCTALQESNYYERILKYYPLMMNNANFESYIEADEYWVDGLSYMSPKALKGTYIIAYLDAVLNTSDRSEFEKQFAEYAKQIDFELYDDDIMPLLSVLELYFYNETGMEISGVDKDNAIIYLEALSKYVNSSHLSEEIRNYINLFIYKWYCEFRNIEKVKEQIEFITKPITSESAFVCKENLENNYLLGFSTSSDSILLGKKSYLDYALGFIDGNIEKYAYAENYICILQNEDGNRSYYIINSKTDEVFGALKENEYRQKCKELNVEFELKEVPYVAIKKQNFTCKEDLINDYMIGISSSDDSLVLGKKYYSDVVLIFDDYNIEKYAYNEKYICVLQNKEGDKNYYIINSETKELFSYLEESEYKQKCKELNINVELKDVKAGQ